MHGFARTASRSSPSSTRSRCSPRWPTGCSSSTAGHSSLTGRRPRSSIRPRSGQRTWARRSKAEVARLTVESLEVGYDGGQVLRGVALEARGGEQQMRARPSACRPGPRLLCLEDRFLGLGRAVVDAFCDALRTVRDGGLTIVATGQHVRGLLRLATRAYLLDEGRVILSGTGAELLASEQVRRTLLP